MWLVGGLACSEWEVGLTCAGWFVVSGEWCVGVKGRKLRAEKGAREES